MVKLLRKLAYYASPILVYCALFLPVYSEDLDDFRPPADMKKYTPTSEQAQLWGKTAFQIYYLSRNQSESGVTCEVFTMITPEHGGLQQNYFLVCSNSVGITLQKLTIPTK